MDLKIKDVAELLNVSETTIRRWLADAKNHDKFPAYLINHQYRFNREEVERWFLRRRQRETGNAFSESKIDEAFPHEIPGGGGSLHFSLYRALHKGDVVDNVKGSDKATVIRNVMDRVADKLGLDAEGITDLLLERERLQTTALGHGIALPHTRDFLLNRNYDIVIFAYPQHPISFEALDGIPVHTLIFLFASNDKRHLHLLAKVAYLASHPPALELLKERPAKDNLLDYIRHWESSLQKTQECTGI